MLRFILRRLGFMVVTVILASIIIFWATTILPGDVATMVLGRYATQQAKDTLRTELGLDKPIAVQYTTWLGKYVRGDWGTSVSTDTAVRPVVFQRLRNSFMLAIVAFALYVPLGILLGLIAALRRNTWVDNAISVGSLAFIGLPEFVSGVILITIFAVQLHWFPAQSAIDPQSSFVAAFPYLILPAITVALTSLAYVIRMTRSSTVDVLQMDYVRTGQSQGPAAAPRAVHPRAAQLAAADDHRGRDRHRLAYRRAHRDRGRVQLPRHRPPAALRHPAARPAAHPVHGAAHRDHLRGRQPGGRHPVRRSEPAHQVQLTRASARGWGGCARHPAAAATVGLSSWTVAATHRWQNEYSCLDRAASLLK